MKDKRPHSHVLLIFYGCLLLLLGSQFLMRDTSVMSHLYRQVPMAFLMRFGVFWCVGIMGAMTIFLLYLRLSRYYLSRTDRLYAAQMSKFILTLVSTGMALSAVAIYFLIQL